MTNFWKISWYPTFKMRRRILKDYDIYIPSRRELKIISEQATQCDYINLNGSIWWKSGGQHYRGKRKWNELLYRPLMEGPVVTKTFCTNSDRADKKIQSIREGNESFIKLGMIVNGMTDG